MTFTFASVLHSQFVVNELVAVGVKVSGMDRLSLSIDDWVGLLPTYGIIIAVGLLVAFLICGGVFRKALVLDSVKRTFTWSLAGTAAIAVILLAMQPIMNITLIAGAREWGFYAQLIAGALGGFVFAKTTLHTLTTNVTR